MYISLQDAKKHLNIDSTFTDDDQYILDLITVAEDCVSKHLDIVLNNLEDGNGMLPPSIIHAILLMVGQFYANREPVSYSSVNSIPLTYEYLISLYKKY